MKLDNFFKLLYTLPVDDYVVRLKLKYDDDNDYRYTNEILEFDGDDYIWSNDWDEGEQDVEVIGYIAVSEIDRFNIPLLKKQDNICTCGNCTHLIFKNYKNFSGTCFYTHRIKSFYDRCEHEEEMS